MKRFSRKFTLIVILSVSAAIVYYSYSYFIENSDSNRDGSGNVAVKVIAKPVEVLSNDRIFKAIGNGKAIQSVNIYSPVVEEVRKISFSSGSKVKKDELLVQLEDEEEVLAVSLAEIELKDAKSLLTRYENAVKDGAVPQSDVDSARASVDGARVKLSQAKFALSERKIKTPFEGVVGLQMIDVGDRISASTVITTLDDETLILIDFDIPESFLSEIKKGDEIIAKTPAYPDKIFKAKIAEIANRVDPISRAITIRAEIENQENLLKSGMSFATEINFSGKDYPAIEEISLQWSKDGAYIWAVRKDIAKKIFVDVISRRDGKVLISGDINDNEIVVIEGVQRLSDGKAVTYSKEAS